jgi:hypothetical protein
MSSSSIQFGPCQFGTRLFAIAFTPQATNVMLGGRCGLVDAILQVIDLDLWFGGAGQASCRAATPRRYTTPALLRAMLRFSRRRAAPRTPAFAPPPAAHACALQTGTAACGFRSV